MNKNQLIEFLSNIKDEREVLIQVGEKCLPIIRVSYRVEDDNSGYCVLVANEEQKEPDDLPRDLNIWVDGACSGNPGPGGWAYIVETSEEVIVLDDQGGHPYTTSPRMEVTAAMMALAAISDGTKKNLDVYSDSQYLIKTMRNEYVKSANIDLWDKLEALAKSHNIRWWHVKKGTMPRQSECDKLAKSEALRVKHTPQ